MLSAFRRLLAFLRRDRLDDDLHEEIRLHLELRRQALIDSGVPPDDADRAARQQFGNITAIRERTRDQWVGPVDSVTQDLRYGVRMIGKAPGFSLVAILSLAVGIGASTVLFSFVNSVLFRPVHAANPEQIVQVFTSQFESPSPSSSSYLDYEAFRSAPVFSGLLASSRTEATLSGQEQRDLVDGVLVTTNYFDVLGLQPSAGRFFRADDDQTGAANPIVVLGHDFWRRRFGADPSIVGRTIELNGRSFTVIGIAPPRFTGTSIERAAGFFVPAAMHETFTHGRDLLKDRRYRAFTLLGRLQSGVSLTQANAALAVVAANLLREHPAAWRDKSGRGRVVTVRREVDGRFAGASPGTTAFLFWSAMGGVFALLAIACVNVATLLLGRATTRRKEIAVRLALGASRRRVVRQLLTECALLAAAGGALGLAMAQSVAGLFIRFRPDGVPPFDLTLDYRIMLFSVAASVLTVVLFGLAPALQTTRPDLTIELKETVRTLRIRGLRFNLRSGLVVTQVAVSLALMVGAGLMLRSAHAGRTEDPGFRRADVLNVGINLTTVPDRNGAHARFYRDAVRSVADIPGVDRVALGALVPMDGSNSQSTIQIGEGASRISASPDVNIVGAGYFALLDIQMKQGREFTPADIEASPRVAVVNETMARHYWNGTPVGRSFTRERTSEQYEIVGVVRDLRHRSFGEEPMPMVYFSAAQSPAPRMTLHVRTTAPPRAIGPAIHQALRDIDRSAGLTAAETMDEFFARMMLPQRAGAGAAMATAVIELSLAVMALYGVIAFAASQRKREIGLRIALGASSQSVIALMMREGIVLTMVGVVLGAGFALAGAAALESLLIGIGPADPVSFGGAALVLLLVGATASFIPARSASSVDPSTTLRSE